MFRATVEKRNGRVVLRLEGSLSGPCVAELERCWTGLAESDGCGPVLVDLTEVTFVSTQAKQLLAAFCCAGAQLTGEGLMARALADELAGVSAAVHNA